MSHIRMSFLGLWIWHLDFNKAPTVCFWISHSLSTSIPASFPRLENIWLNWDANAGHYRMPRGLHAWCKLPVMKAMIITQLVSRQGVRVPCKGQCFKRVPFLTACIYVWVQAINRCTNPVTRNGMHVVRFTAKRQCPRPLWRRETLKQSKHDCMLQSSAWLKHLSITGQTVCF